MDIILKYFPKLSEEQIEQFKQLDALYREWNAKINVISRKDIDHLYEHHVLHSLAIAKAVNFKAGARVMDLGTGGGFPGIPLAILFPKTNFLMIDGTGKKIRVVNIVIEALGLKNATAQQIRAEELKGQKFDFVVTRAVARLEKLVPWSRRLLRGKEMHAIPNGLIALKGGRVKEEIADLEKGEYVESEPISRFFDEPYFEEKFLVYVQR